VPRTALSDREPQWVFGSSTPFSFSSHGSWKRSALGRKVKGPARKYFFPRYGNAADATRIRPPRAESYPEQIAVIDGVAGGAGPMLSFSIDAIVGRRLAAARSSAGDRVAYLAPNTHAQLGVVLLVPQLGAVLVPLNFRPDADDFLYLINQRGARVGLRTSRYLEPTITIRSACLR